MTQTELKKRIIKAIQSDSSEDIIKNVRLYGSHLHGNAESSSDIDLLIDFREPVSLFQLSAIQFRLEDELGSRVDLSTPNSLSKYIRTSVLEEAEMVYER